MVNLPASPLLFRPTGFPPPFPQPKPSEITCKLAPVCLALGEPITRHTGLVRALAPPTRDDRQARRGANLCLVGV